MLLTLRDNLLFVSVIVSYQGIEARIDNVLIDTGSVASILSMNHMEKLGITPAPDDALRRVHGIGGTEVVLVRCVDYLQVDELKLADFEIEIGNIDYGFDINGILGMDFLTQAGAVINLPTLTITFFESVRNHNNCND